MKILLIPAMLSVALGAAGAAIPANDPAVRYVGRTAVSPEGEVSYDWSGTYFSTVLYGDSMDALFTCEGDSWFNVFVDGKQTGTFQVNSADTLVNIVSGLGRGAHRITVQKRSEGEYGKITVKEFSIPSKARLEAPADIPERHMEFIGNSLTCGFGTEGADRDEPFKVSTENCNYSYAVVTARYFGADYTLISHSGQGAARNYGDSVRVSAVTMKDRMLRTFDTDTVKWKGGYSPDIVVINLGTNDFSLEPHPYKSEFVGAYCRIIGQIRELYGNIPVLCVCPPTLREPVDGYYDIVKEKLGDPDVHVIHLTYGLYNSTTDLGSAWHPNRSGQAKMAMSLIPYISTITGWDLVPGKPVE